MGVPDGIRKTGAAFRPRSTIRSVTVCAVPPAADFMASAIALSSACGRAVIAVTRLIANALPSVDQNRHRR